MADQKPLVRKSGRTQSLPSGDSIPIGVQVTSVIPITDKDTAVTTGTGKITFFAIYAATIVSGHVGVSTQSTSGSVTCDLNDDGTSVFSTQKPSIDANEDTSLTGPAVTVANPTVAAGSKMTIDVDAAGTGAKGLNFYLTWYRTA